MIKEKEDKIYNKIMELKKGDEKDRLVAFKCIGILSNESTSASLDEKLDIVSEIIEKHIKRK